MIYVKATSRLRTDRRGHLDLLMDMERLVEALLGLQLFADALSVETMKLHAHTPTNSKYN